MSPTRRMRQVLVRMPEAMHEALVVDAANNDRTISATVRRALREYLEPER